MTQLLTVARQLVQIPSVNPMGQSAWGDNCYEHRVTDYIESFLRRVAVPCERHTVQPRRDNLVARIEGWGSEGDRPLVLFEVHQDTVPVEGMTIEPFGGHVQDGRLYGRGACDVKGSLAVLLCLMERLVRTRPAGMPDVVLACTVNEEHGFTGAQHLCRLWEQGQSQLLPRRPDFALVFEPTELNVVVAHKGAVRWQCHTLGRAAHSSAPGQGCNAIYLMQRVLASLQEYADQVLPHSPSHPRVGTATLNVGRIQGGISVNTVPDRCTIEVDRRTLPGEDPMAAQQDVIHHVQAATDQSAAVRHDSPYLLSPGLSDDNNQALADRLLGALAKLSCPGRAMGVPFGTDAGVISTHGVPTVVFGPGSIRQAHTSDEWIAVDQLEVAEQVLNAFCCDW